MRVAIIGTGYVGLVSGACLADCGHQVICVDMDATKIQALERGEIPIFEPGLKDLVGSNVREGRLSFSTTLVEPVAPPMRSSLRSERPPDAVTGTRTSLMFMRPPGRSLRRSRASRW